ncbi:hypothetical protein K493DRAFT_308267 [Basidiobolus meristosporus CBS 931.73]|uniref:CBM1 domain-containing protein n=1 Tax=Basidiobolus meristosporus CBS 931.73 TaxID=1314790 RepID=A0A1Y1X4K1_9FUNG|nr:hypothetical protein K493DRAFT_308267 [Basidiobolus meristosporus CBS 931.73]|eukprot:ORX80713.1 hypothetical protein K493DRAFT_308267 [Basidiobolus meristosporus CBS 931.73]
MRFTTAAVILALASLQLAGAAPIGCSSPCTSEYKRVHYRSSPCAQYAEGCYQNVQVLPTIKTTNIQAPLLRQVFTTVTRKHDNLNTANANSDKGFNAKYQAGPSLEAEGSASALEYAKQKEAEHSDDSYSNPYVFMQPTHDVQYSEPMVETQCVSDCPEQNEQYTEPMENTECADNCA